AALSGSSDAAAAADRGATGGAGAIDGVAEESSPTGLGARSSATGDSVAGDASPRATPELVPKLAGAGAAASVLRKSTGASPPTSHAKTPSPAATSVTSPSGSKARWYHGAPGAPVFAQGRW